MDWKKRELIQSHIATHTKRSAEDQAAVFTLEYFLRSEGRINTDFSSVDKWPNHDGTFEFVSDPDIIRCPKQSFSVQIKGTHNCVEKEGVISYSLKSLAYPAYIANNVTADPGILFVVIDPDVRGKERIYWKYLSPSIINMIDFSKDSYTIKFCQEDEIRNTDESIGEFCEKLNQIIETHLFLQKLCKESLKKEEALEMINYRCQEISMDIELVSVNFELRDYVSRRIVTGLYDLCYAAMILNAIKLGYTDLTEQLAWEISQFNIETKYLSNFLKGLKYIDHRIPKEGQSERLMLKYYSYLWEIRRFLKKDFSINVLENLEKFPLNLDTLDTEYYETVAEGIENTDLTPRNVRVSRYYIQKKIPFFVKGDRYFEITLQLAGLYSTKYNRITVYSKKNISTNYSIQIAYSETEIELWGIKNRIKIINDWKVAIDPTCLNKLAKMFKIPKKINRNYGEYINLMRFLTETGMSLLEIINQNESRFHEIYNYVYGSTNTHDFGDILLHIRDNYSKASCKVGKNTVCYCLLSMREEVLEDLFPNQYNSKRLSEELYIRSKCYPFEKNPFISNLVGRKTITDIKNILEIVDDSEKVALVQPYLKIEQMIRETGELYFEEKIIASREVIEKYNASLDSWERREGLLITENKGLVSIESYEITTLFILKKLLGMSHDTNQEQQNSNERYLRNCGFEFEDPLKRVALKNLFVYSNIILIYGAAGTGKTTLINYISCMMNQSRKLYLTKTHTALQNLQRRVKNTDENCAFSIIDSITRSNSLVDYDIVFIDECSTIDNRTMKSLLERTDNDTMLVLSGDIYQIESIDFGNWFYYAKDIIKVKGASIELLNTWRTDKEELKSLWNEIREKKPIITEKLSMDGPFSEDLGENIFKREDDEVVLCLNYDGKFGLNNMNQYFQNANTQSEEVFWAEWTFKIGDPIVFVDTKRSQLLYNNLRGTIVDIMKEESKIVFTIDIKTFLTREQCEYEEFEYLLNNGDETRIRLDVIAWDDELPEDDRRKTVIPFQIAYAISIHKAQGLEYKTVKVVIPSSNTEKITHSIFYTAITRAKENLKIFWSAETMEKIVKSFTIEKVEQNTLQIIKEKLK